MMLLKYHFIQTYGRNHFAFCACAHFIRWPMRKVRVSIYNLKAHSTQSTGWLLRKLSLC